MTNDEILFDLHYLLEYPNHWVGENGKDRMIDGQPIIASAKEFSDSKVDFDFYDDDGELERFTSEDNYPDIVPDAFKGRTHFCANLLTYDNSSLLIVRFDKMKIYGEINEYEDVALYWNKNLVGELKLLCDYEYLDSVKIAKKSEIHNLDLWDSEVIPFYKKLKVIADDRWAKLKQELAAWDAAKKPPSKI